MELRKTDFHIKSAGVGNQTHIQTSDIQFMAKQKKTHTTVSVRILWNYNLLFFNIIIWQHSSSKMWRRICQNTTKNMVANDHETSMNYFKIVSTHNSNTSICWHVKNISRHPCTLKQALLIWHERHKNQPKASAGKLHETSKRSDAK